MTVLIGREKETDVLLTHLENVLSSKGSTIFISGEAGIGKTRLSEECITLAQTKGFKIMRGWCLHSSLTPYMPIREALRNGGLEQLISSETPPKLEAVFLITNTGLLLSKCEREASPIDSDIFTGMLTAVTQFIDDCIRQSGRLLDGNVFRLSHGSFNISAISGGTATIASVFTGRENEFLFDDMESVLFEIENKFSDKIQAWMGALKEFAETKNNLKVLFDSEKFEGIDWTKDDPKSKQSNIFENVTRGLIRQSRTQSLLLFIDDLQWADPSTLALLHYLARNIRSSRILILGTYRPEDIVQSWDGKTHQLTDTMQLMNREYLYEKLDLKNLKEEEVAGLIRTSLGRIEGELEFVDLIWKESQGNPLFVLELLNLLKEESVLVEKEGKWKVNGELKTIDIPSKIHDVIARRLSRLLKEQKQILEFASIIGEVFSSDILETVAEVKRLELLRTLNEIEKVHKLIETIEKKYRFSHVKIREVLHNGLSDELKREYHLLVGDTISKSYGESEETVSDIGYHYYKAQNAEKAVPPLMKAIELAKNEYANAEVVRYCNYALELMNEDKWKTEIVKVLEQLGDIQELIGNYDEAVKSYEQALDLADALETKARMHRKLSTVLVKEGKYDNAFAGLKEGERLIRNEKSPELGRLLSGIGFVHEHRGDYERAVSFQKDAMRIFSFFEGAEKDVANVFNRIGGCHWDKSEYEESLEFYKKSLKIVERLDDQRGIGLSSGNIGNVFYYKGEFDKALEFYVKSLKIFEKIGDQRGIGGSFNNIGNVFSNKGEYDKALEFYQKGLKIFEKIGDQLSIGISSGNIGGVFYYKGEYDKALKLYEKSLKIFKNLGDQSGISYALCDMSEALLKNGSLNKAEEHAKIALESAQLFSVKKNEGRAFKILGMIFTERKEWDKSENYFEDSVAVLKGIGMKKELALTCLEYGRMLKMKGDKEKTKEKLNEGLRLFEELRLMYRADETKKELEGL